MNEEKRGFSVISIVGFILAFIASPVGLVLSIIGLVKKDGKRKGLSIAGLIISIIVTLGSILLALIMCVCMIPMFIRTNEMVKVHNDQAFCEDICNALVVSMYDPAVMMNPDFPITSSYIDIQEIPEGAYRDAVENNLGMKLEDLMDNVQSHHSSDGKIMYKLDFEGCSVKITSTNVLGNMLENPGSNIKYEYLLND